MNLYTESIDRAIVVGLQQLWEDSRGNNETLREEARRQLYGEWLPNALAGIGLGETATWLQQIENPRCPHCGKLHHEP